MLTFNTVIIIHRLNRSESFIAIITDWIRIKFIFVINMRSHTRCGEDFDISSDDTNGNIRSFNCYQWYSNMQSSLELSKEWHRPNSQSVNSISQATANPLQRQKDNSLLPYKSSLERNEFLSPDHISVTRQIQCCCSQDANVNRISEQHHGRINKIVTLEGDITRGIEMIVRDYE